jgi:hypothetical protein
MICSGFEPNWALEITCNGEAASNFIDAFSGDGIQTTPGSISFASEDPWQLETSHPVTGSIAYTPNGCTDESDAVSATSPSHPPAHRACPSRSFRSAAGLSVTGITRPRLRNRPS